jgi:hypothetical protein
MHESASAGDRTILKAEEISCLLHMAKGLVNR